MIISISLIRIQSILHSLVSLSLLFSSLIILSPSLASSLPVGTSKVEYDISVYVDPVEQTIKGRNVITARSMSELTLALNSRFRVTNLLVNGVISKSGGIDHGAIKTWRISNDHHILNKIEVSWEGELLPLNTSLNHHQTLNRGEPVSGRSGTFLPDSSGWYPHIIGELASYRVKLRMPKGQRGVVAGKIVEESISDKEFSAIFVFPFPSEGIDFMGGPYIVESDSMYGVGGKSIQLRTYFHPEIKGLANEYLSSVKKYIQLYESWIGEYPFTEFSVISSPTPTGFGMPTLTYLGISVLRLPFIRNTSLGHEVLHNWWGNGVYPYYPEGNWSEGLTTFMADYAYKERMGAKAAKEMRLGWLRDFSTLSPDQDFILKKFTTRKHGASKIVGYNKAAMIFLMLRDLIGQKSFDRSLRIFWKKNQFRIASWSDLQEAFEAGSGRKLQVFFEQWLTYPGAPSIRMIKARNTRLESGYQITVNMEQVGSSYNLHIPIVIHTEKESKTKIFNMDRENQAFSFELLDKPIKLTLDPDFRLLRRLAPDEAPPILRKIMLDQSTETIILSEENDIREVSMVLARKLLHRTPEMGSLDANKATSILVIGLQNQVNKWLDLNNLPLRPSNMQNIGTAYVWTMRQEGKTFVIVSAKDALSLQYLVRPLPHYGRQSYIIFDGAKVIERGIWPAQVQEIVLN
tara:strand:+ start:5729 stop:7792 length:2064 start_codon:yes stop_codon:yes gene_type:complete